MNSARKPLASATTDETICPVFRRKYSFPRTLFRKPFSCIALAHWVWLRLLRGVAIPSRLLPFIHRPDEARHFGTSCPVSWAWVATTLNPQLSDRHAFYSSLGNASRNQVARVTVR